MALQGADPWAPTGGVEPAADLLHKRVNSRGSLASMEALAHLQGPADHHSKFLAQELVRPAPQSGPLMARQVDRPESGPLKSVFLSRHE